MLALVKNPHIELSIHGEHIDELLTWIKKKYDVAGLADEEKDEFRIHSWQTGEYTGKEVEDVWEGGGSVLASRTGGRS